MDSILLLTDDRLMKYLFLHIFHNHFYANVRMNDIFEYRFLDNGQNNQNLITNDHVHHYNHVKLH